MQTFTPFKLFVSFVLLLGGFSAAQAQTRSSLSEKEDILIPWIYLATW